MRSKRIAIIFGDERLRAIVLSALADARAVVTVFDGTSEIRSGDFEAVVLVGNVTSAVPGVSRVIHDFVEQQNPIASIGEAGISIAQALGHKGVTLTIGHDDRGLVKKSGAYHETCTANDYVTDREYRVISTPGDCIGSALDQVSEGVRGAIRELVEMA